MSGEDKGARAVPAAIHRAGIIDIFKWNRQVTAVPFVPSEGVAGECRAIDGHSTGLKTGPPSAFLVAGQWRPQRVVSAFVPWTFYRYRSTPTAAPQLHIKDGCNPPKGPVQGPNFAP